MDLPALWRSLRGGESGPGFALILAAGAFLLGLLLQAALRPVFRALTAHDNEKIRDRRYHRLKTTYLFAAIAFAVFIYVHATVPAAARRERLGYQLPELVFVVLCGYAVFELLLLFLMGYVPKTRGRAPVVPIAQDLIRTLALLGFVFLGIKQAFPSADLGALLTTSAILSIVLGLALQESLSNVFAGIMLTIDHPFKPGDWIEVDGQEAKILDSNWRSTRVLTRDDDVIYIPNSTLAKGNITNFTDPTGAHLCRRKMGIEYGAPPNKVRTALLAAMSHVDGVLQEPAPDAWVLDYGDSAIVYELRFWIDRYERRPRIEAEVMRGLWYHLKREGISIPFPIRDVYLRREKPAQRPEELIALLKRVDILQPLKEEELQMLAGDLGHQLFAKGEHVCRQGEQGSTFYLVKSGSISVRVKGADGVEAEVAKLPAGSYFGEMSLLTGDPRTSTCTAIEDSEILSLDRETFAVLLQENPSVAQSMSDILAARQTATQEKLTQERETMVRRRAEAVPAASQNILDKIRTIFKFKK